MFVYVPTLTYGGSMLLPVFKKCVDGVPFRNCLYAYPEHSKTNNYTQIN